MSKHTPGPWKWEEGYFGLNGKGGQKVLHFEDHEGLYLDATNEQQHANARLIAAAPVMLEALEEIAAIAASLKISLLVTKAIWAAKGV